MANVLIIGDTHCPCMLDGYVDFLRDVYKWWGCSEVVHIGDLVDNCALSFHLKRPHQKDPVREYLEAKKQAKEITKAFPRASLLLGNHDVLPYRWAEQVGIPDEMLKDYSGIFDLPSGWKVFPRYSQLEIEGVIYQHGDRGKGGRMSAANNARCEFKSVVQGHHHSQAGVEFFANKSVRVFGLQVGCGVDWEHHQMNYGAKYTSKPIVGCGIVCDGVAAYFEAMHL